MRGPCCGRGDRRRTEGNARGTAVSLTAGVILAVLLAAVPALGSPDISVTDIEFGIVAQGGAGSRPSLSENQAILGDTVRVRAVVHNNGDSASGVFSVEFYFIEISSQETDRIGSATVFGLAPGEQLKPAVTLDTSALAPGIYEIVVKADPGGTLGETNLCNNEIPREACPGDVSKESSAYTLTLLRQGAAISDVQAGTTLAFPMCRMGALVSSQALNFYNVGTESLSRTDYRVSIAYRTDLTDSFTDLATSLLATSQPSLSNPGEETTLFVGWSDSLLNKVFGEISDSEHDLYVGLGKSLPIQIRISIAPIGEDGTSSVLREVFLPAKRERSNLYSTVDLWTFPERPACSASLVADTGNTVRVAPAVGPDDLIYHVLGGPGGDELFALNVNGEVLWSLSLSGELTTVAFGRYEGTAEAHTTVLYVGSSDGKLYALRSRKTEDTYTVEQLWEKSVGAVTARPVVSGDKTRVIVGSASGLFVFDENGTEKAKVTNKGAVSLPPLYVDATKETWFASGSTVYKASEDAAILCTHNAGSNVTTPLETNAGQTVVYFGTEDSLLWAIGTVKGADCKPKTSLDLASPVSGLSVLRPGDARRDEIYVTTEDGHAHLVRYAAPTLTQEEDRKLLRKIVETPPALVVSDNRVRAVFVVSPSGELKAVSDDLGQVLDVEVWGESVPYQFVSGKAMTAPVIYTEADPMILLVGSADGVLYAFDLSQLR